MSEPGNKVTASAATPESAAITLTKKQVVTAGREAFLAGRLIAQQPGFRPYAGCQYRSPKGLPCIIGAALTNQEAAFLDGSVNGQSIEDLAELRIVKTRSALFFQQLQSAHDRGRLDILAELLGLEADGASSTSTTDASQVPGSTS